MTGYGKAETIINKKKIHVEVKSLNSKNADISMHITSLFFLKDLEIRSFLTEKLTRGKIDFNLWVEDLNAAQSNPINQDAIHSYIEQIRSISKAESIAEPQDWWAVLNGLPEITVQTTPEEISDEDWKPVKKAIAEAVDNLIAFRRQEGTAVKLKFDEKLRNISHYLASIAPYEKERTEKIKDDLMERLQKLPSLQYDKNRLEQEMIYYIEKLDINEEKQRLKNHLKYFAETMEQNEPQGKKLGFISQEMGREINTMGSKSNQAEMQNLVVKMKDELEQIKEQVLNVL